MTPIESLSIVGIIFLIVLLLGHPLAFTLGGLSVLFAATLWGNIAALNLFMRTTTSICTNIVYVSVPLFIFMGTILERSGAAEDLFESMYVIFGKIRGGLAIATVIICTLLAAASGIIGASLTLMTMLALPTMMKYKYDRDLATGTIMASGCLGTIIPPSIILVIYGAQAQISIGKLFAGGMGPGILLAALYLTYIVLRVIFQPDSAPAIDRSESDKYSGTEKLLMLLKSVLPTLGLIFLVLGSIIFGWATPTEAAALGCVGAFGIAIMNKRLNWSMVRDCCYLTMRTNAMIMWIILGASMFTSVFLGLGGGDLISELVNSLEVSRWLVLFFILFLLLIMGMFIDCYGVLLIGIPVFTPIVYALGFDPLWFAIIFAVMIQASYLSPPFAYAAFYVKGVAVESGIDIPIGQLYLATFTFLGLQIIGVVLLCIFPEIITWLPSQLF
jgi:tripartite ATP-independent transporter DctM subunit